MAVVRGDHDVNEVRLARALGVDEVFLAGEADVEKATGAKVGFAGPVGFKGKVLVDRAASRVRERRHRRQRDRLPPQGRPLRPRLRRRDGRRPPPGDDGRPLPQLRRRQAHAVPGHRGGAHLHPRHEVLGRRWARRFIDEKQQTQAARHGLLRHRRLAPRRDDDRAAPRRQRHPLADERRAVPRAPRAPSAREDDVLGDGARALRRARQARASRSSGTTATSARA